jgi:8-oxo-dGTP diphosphatase
MDFCGREAVSGAPVPIGLAVVEHDGRFLVGTRPAGVPLAGCAEFPGGKCLSGETPEDCAIRECEEETGLAVEVRRMLERVNFSYPHGDVELSFYLCRCIGETTPRPPFRWVERAELSALRFPEANRSLIHILSETNPM